MAGFKTHITVSSLLGAGGAAAAYMLYDVPLPSCVLAGGLCGVSGMLPDLDSDSGAPLRESMAFAAAVVPMLLIHRFQTLGLSHELMILAGAGAYLLIRFGLTELLKRFTVHRGMFHSLPAAVIAGELGFLLASGEDVRLRVFKAGAVVVGYVSHLLLDELYSFEWYHGRMRLKHSFGSALKLFGREWWPNVWVLAKLAILTYLVLREPNLIHHYRGKDAGPTAQQTATQTVQGVRR